MAIGSCITPAPRCSAAAVASDLRAAPSNTPCFQSKASKTRGTPRGLRPPKMMPEMGTPSGSSQLGWMVGHCWAGTQNLELGWAALPSSPNIHFLPVHVVTERLGSTSFSMPSQNTLPSSVTATFVKMVFFWEVSMATGFVFQLVPGATPKKPFSGLIALSTPFLSKRIQAMSSPTTLTCRRR